MYHDMMNWHWGFGWGHWGLGVIFWVIILGLVGIGLKSSFTDKSSKDKER